MLTTEENLKAYILSKYKSVREFTQTIGIPYSTLDNALKRGIDGIAITRAIKICQALEISTDELAHGRITPIKKAPPKNISELQRFFDRIMEDLTGEEKNELIIDIEDYIRMRTERIKKKRTANYEKQNNTQTKIQTINSNHEQYNQSYKLKETNVIYFPEETINYVNVHGKVSAGNGILLPEYENIEEVPYTENIPEHDFALQVAGDSMLPMFKDGEIIFVKAQSDIENGQIGIISINEEAYVKKIYRDNEKLRLVSLNKEYTEIIPETYDDIKIFGKVII